MDAAACRCRWCCNPFCDCLSSMGGGWVTWFDLRPWIDAANFVIKVKSNGQKTLLAERGIVSNCENRRLLCNCISVRSRKFQEIIFNDIRSIVASRLFFVACLAESEPENYYYLKHCSLISRDGWSFIGSCMFHSFRTKCDLDTAGRAVLSTTWTENAIEIAWRHVKERKKSPSSEIGAYARTWCWTCLCID